MGSISTMMIDCAYNEIGKHLGLSTDAINRLDLPADQAVEGAARQRRFVRVTVRAHRADRVEPGTANTSRF